MLVTVVQCANGRVLWVRVQRTQRAAYWICTRDQFRIDAPLAAAAAEACLSSIAQHSVSLAGAIQNIVQLSL